MTKKEWIALKPGDKIFLTGKRAYYIVIERIRHQGIDTCDWVVKDSHKRKSWAWGSHQWRKILMNNLKDKGY